MTRPAKVQIDSQALLHNLSQVHRHAPGRGVIAMVKSNAYGCGIARVAPVLADKVMALGVACLEEAMAIRALGITRDCVLMQGAFSADEISAALDLNCHCVIQQACQLRWLLDTPLSKKMKVWVKVNTGMNRLGFLPSEVYDVLSALQSCPWVHEDVGLMTHFACADEPGHSANRLQLQAFGELNLPAMNLVKSMANSAAILSLPESHADVVRPGIMLYGVSPFAAETGVQQGLKPVMRFSSAITALRQYPAGVSVGYGASWTTSKPSSIAVVAAGYGDGYPRHIAANTPVAVNGQIAPIVGRISMDMLTIDVSECQNVSAGDEVELWGPVIPVETVARQAGTIAYELLCQYTPRTGPSSILEQ